MNSQLMYLVQVQPTTKVLRTHHEFDPTRVRTHNLQITTEHLYVVFKYDLGQKYKAPYKFDPTGVRTHDIQIMSVYFMSLRRLL